MTKTKRMGPMFQVGDRVRFNPETYNKNAQWVSPERDARMLADRFVVVQCTEASGFATLRSETTGRTLGGMRKVLIPA